MSVKRKWSGFTSRDERGAERDRVRAEEEKLKAAGLKASRYFQYRNVDEKGKTDAKAQADAWAALIREQVGVEMDVAEGFFL